MKKADIEKQMDLLGKWTAHKIKIISDEGDLVYTKDGEPNGNRELMDRLTQVIVDTVGEINDLSFIDLACLEGLHGINLACMGAKNVTFVDVRKENIDKTNFSINAIGLNNCKTYLDDIRNLSGDIHGIHDVAICFGFIYLFDYPEIFETMKKISSVSSKAIIFDAIFKDDESTEVIYENRKYYGYLSFDKFDKSYMWGLYNDKYPENSDVRTFKFSYKSFIDYLNHLGFSSIYEVMVPIPANPNALNKTILAIKNKVIREELPLI